MRIDASADEYEGMISRSYQAHPVSDSRGSVHSQDNTSHFIVTLSPSGRPPPYSGACSCLQFQSNARPCPHVICLMNRLRDVIRFDYFNPVYCLTAWQAAYSRPYEPVLISGLDEAVILPPRLKEMTGRR